MGVFLLKNYKTKWYIPRLRPCIFCGATTSTLVCHSCQPINKRLNNIWNNIKLRCGQRKQHTANHYEAYKDVKNEFGSWDEFRLWALPLYKPGLCIHRKDKNYSPASCEFVDWYVGHKPHRLPVAS